MRFKALKVRAYMSVVEYSGTTENEALYRQLINGDASARNGLIENNLDLVARRVAGFIKRVPNSAYLESDFVSQGQLSLIEAIDALAKNPTCENATAYLSKAIICGIDSVFNDEVAVLAVPRRTMYRALANGVDLKLPSREPMYEGDCDDDDKFEPPDLSSDYLEEIAASCEAEQEHAAIGAQIELIRSRQPVLSVDQLSVVLNVSANWVYQMLAKIFGRYKTRRMEWPRQETYEKRGFRHGKSGNKNN